MERKESGETWQPWGLGHGRHQCWRTCCVCVEIHKWIALL